MKSVLYWPPTCNIYMYLCCKFIFFLLKYVNMICSRIIYVIHVIFIQKNLFIRGALKSMTISIIYSISLHLTLLWHYWSIDFMAPCWRNISFLKLFSKHLWHTAKLEEFHIITSQQPPLQVKNCPSLQFKLMHVNTSLDNTSLELDSIHYLLDVKQSSQFA